MTSNEPVPNMAAIADRYHHLKERLNRLAGDRVRIVAVTKTFPIDAVRAVHAAGCERIGENYAQEVTAKFSDWTASDGDRPEIHFIGGLQTNKVRSLVGMVDLWQTVDRESLLDEIARRAPKARVLIQVNATNEATKSGCRLADVEGLVGRAIERGLRVEGLMTVGPTQPDASLTRRAFRTVAQMARQLDVTEVSMGMSGDWELAVEEGSTLIRVGSAIFGDRPPPTR